jgi:hypothetical protein
MSWFLVAFRPGKMSGECRRIGVDIWLLSYYLEGSCQLTSNCDQIELLDTGRPGIGFRSKARGSSPSNAMDHNYTSPLKRNRTRGTSKQSTCAYGDKRKRNHEMGCSPEGILPQKEARQPTNLADVSSGNPYEQAWKMERLNVVHLGEPRY